MSHFHRDTLYIGFDDAEIAQIKVKSSMDIKWQQRYNFFLSLLLSSATKNTTKIVILKCKQIIETFISQKTMRTNYLCNANYAICFQYKNGKSAALKIWWNTRNTLWSILLQEKIQSLLSLHLCCFTEN